MLIIFQIHCILFSWFKELTLCAARSRSRLHPVYTQCQACLKRLRPKEEGVCGLVDLKRAAQQLADNQGGQLLDGDKDALVGG